MDELLKPPRDRDVFQDDMHRVYVAVGHIQPPNRVLCYLKYIPHPSGLWVSNNRHYARVFEGSVASILVGMNELPSRYLIDDPHFGVVLPEVPHHAIAHYYSPERRLEEIVEYGPSDSLEAVVKLISEAIHDYLGIDMRYLGVTGSIAWHAHNPLLSDVNLNVYGLRNAQHLQDEFTSLSDHPDFRLCGKSDWAQSLARLRSRIPMLNEHEICRLFQRRTALCYDRLRITPTPILLPNEAPIPYRSESYLTLSAHPVTIRMIVDNDLYSPFLPSIIVGESDPLPEINGLRVSRVMVFDGVFRGLIHAGDQIEITGSLQRVMHPDDPDFDDYQIMVGTQRGTGREFIRLIDDDA